jgi:hypothetical protein
MPPAARSAPRSARRSAVRRAVPALAAAWLLAACGAGPEPAPPTGIDELQIPTESPDPTDFVAEIDNPYLPLVPGSRWVYESQGEDPETITVTVTDETRVVAGVTTTVVSDVVTDADGKVVEETLDWFAQDTDGNVWYFGEDTTEYDDRGRPDTAGSWEAGVDGAQAGLVMPAMPRLGDGFRQEYAEGEAEDQATVLAVDDARTIGLGSYSDVVVTEDTTPLEPDLVERKYYAPGVGLIYEETVSGGTERVELVSYTEG